MARRILTPEDKAANAVLTAMENRDYNRYNLAHILLTSEKDWQKNLVIGTAAAVMELAAISYDYGDFTSETRPWIYLARDCRKIILDHALQSM